MDGGTGERDVGLDTDPFCHLDCFRDRFCVDGDVHEVEHAPQPCGTRSCPTEILGTCPDGCAPAGCESN